MIPPIPPNILVAARGPEGPFQNGLRQALLGGRIQLLGNAHTQPIAKVAKVGGTTAMGYKHKYLRMPMKRSIEVNQSILEGYRFWDIWHISLRRCYFLRSPRDSTPMMLSCDQTSPKQTHLNTEIITKNRPSPKFNLSPAKKHTGFCMFLFGEAKATCGSRKRNHTGQECATLKPQQVSNLGMLEIHVQSTISSVPCSKDSPLALGVSPLEGMQLPE